MTALLGGTREAVINAVSNAWIDGHPLRVYRQAPNAGSRKGWAWAAADASSRAVMLGLMALKGEMGYPSALTAKTWGFYDALFQSDYENAAAADPRIDRLCELMVVREDKRYTSDFYDAEKRSNANAITVVFKDGSRTPKVSVEYPLGHSRRREDGMPLLLQKFKVNLARRYPPQQQAAILELCTARKRLESTPVHEFVDMFAA